MNKFFILNTMQKSIASQGSGCWVLNASHRHAQVKRTRAISFIFKTSSGYLVTRTGSNHKTFMAALASLLVEFISAIRVLITSMLFDDSSQDIERVFHRAFTDGLYDGSQARIK